VLVEKQVVKVLFDDNKRAFGVEYQTNPKYLANPEYLATAYTALRTVSARKMVVLSAGANATPGILERSGIGDPQILQRADEAIKNTDELLGTNAMDAQGKFRPTEAEVEHLGPEFKKAWDRDFKDVPDRPLMILALYCW
jgi:alcohol oxidase